MVASSLVRAEKSAGAREAYNERARECREVLAVVARPSGTYREFVTDNDPTGCSIAPAAPSPPCYSVASVMS